ncbi:MAG: hypothetical protein GDA43_16005 [Hormoscilla sp. SP5CHS1]|nr:hypothetical protein [Hormoscilla sp. SP12CHS1]MBC6454509.1 hypothetical protein [Hormoscilla sp. SP5CHS1]MBC6474266.1 hypothetical protein [Hormoscilla sp. GM102CHS1]
MLTQHPAVDYILRLSFTTIMLNDRPLILPRGDLPLLHDGSRLRYCDRPGFRRCLETARL